RFLPRSRAVTATTSIERPQRALSASRCCASRRTTAPPTVPRPARPIFSGAATARSAPRRQGHDVVQLFDAALEEAADVARGLADALLVLNQRDADEAFAVLAEPHAGRDRDLRLLHQELRELDAAKRLERLRYRRPGEHRCARRRNRPAG